MLTLPTATRSKNASISEVGRASARGTVPGRSTGIAIGSAGGTRRTNAYVTGCALTAGALVDYSATQTVGCAGYAHIVHQPVARGALAGRTLARNSAGEAVGGASHTGSHGHVHVAGAALAHGAFSSGGTGVAIGPAGSASGTAVGEL